MSKRKFKHDSFYKAVYQGEPVLAYYEPDIDGEFVVGQRRAFSEESFDWIGPEIVLNDKGEW